MRYLQPHLPDDNAILAALSNNQRLAVRPHLQASGQQILAQYAAYLAVSGNAVAVGAPSPLALTDDAKELLRGCFGSEPVGLEFIAELRVKASPEVCTMCGSLGSGTLDHIFPQSLFAELSFFSRNLVPACSKCNSRRGNSYKGNGNERVLHPFFDSRMTDRLVRAKVTANPTFRTPAIELELCVAANHPLYAAASYHLRHVIKDIPLSSMESHWVNILRYPSVHFVLPPGDLDTAAMRTIAIAELQRLDLRRATPNNWESMLVAGIVANDDALAYLANHINDRVPPEDI